MIKKMKERPTILNNKPKDWRDGQTIFNFLEWLCYQKGYSENQNIRMADPFHIYDEDFDELYKEFLSELI